MGTIHPFLPQKVTPACPSLPIFRNTEWDSDLWPLHYASLLQYQAFICTYHHATAPLQSKGTVYRRCPSGQWPASSKACRSLVMGEDRLWQHTALGRAVVLSCSAKSKLWWHLNREQRLSLHSKYNLTAAFFLTSILFCQYFQNNLYFQWTQGAPVHSGVGLPIVYHFLLLVFLGAFSQFIKPFHVLHICGKATLWDYHVVNYAAFHLRGCFVRRMGWIPRWDLPVVVLAGVCTILMPTISSSTAYANGLH